jgi:catechol 2,3-dioxygenase-like lactoylglutathione lyase family enzyme
MRLSAVRLFVRDLESAAAFYGAVLSLPHVAGTVAWGYLVFDASGVELVIEAVAADAPVEDQALVGRFTGLSFEVDDIVARYSDLRGKGADFTGAPERQAWGGVLATFLDPAGNQLQLVQRPHG